MTERSAGLAMAQLRSARNAPQTTRRRAALRWATANPNGQFNQGNEIGKEQRLHRIVDTTNYRHEPNFSSAPKGLLIRGQVSDLAQSSCERELDFLDRPFARAGRSEASGQSLRGNYSLREAPASGPD